MTAMYLQPSHKISFLPSLENLVMPIHQTPQLKPHLFWHKVPFVTITNEDPLVISTKQTFIFFNNSRSTLNLTTVLIRRSYFSTIFLTALRLFSTSNTKNQMLQLWMLSNFSLVFYTNLASKDPNLLLGSKNNPIRHRPLISTFRHL